MNKEGEYIKAKVFKEETIFSSNAENLSSIIKNGRKKDDK